MSEAKLLAYVLARLSVPKGYIVILDEGKNIGENVLAVKEETSPRDTTIWCCTQRLSLRLERTQAQQAPDVKSYWYVSEQSLAEVIRYCNGKILCDGQMLLYELASILDKCFAYAGKFQKPLDFEVGYKVEQAAALLEEHFRLTLPYQKLRADYLNVVSLNKAKIKASIEAEIRTTAEDFWREGLIP